MNSPLLEKSMDFATQIVLFYEEYARKVIGRAYFIVLNKIDELAGTNERLLKYYRENIEKH